MIRSTRNEHRVDLFAFASDLTAWMRGEEDECADAAAQDIAEILLLFRTWLRARMKKTD